MENAIIYTRFSPHKTKNNKHESCETQEALCRTLAKAEKLNVIKTIHDPDISGKDEYRENLWLAINMMKKGNVLLVYKRDRLARNVYLSEQINRSVKKKGGRILAVAGDIDGDGPEQELIRQVLAAISEYERKLISMRTSHAMKHHQRSGRAMSSQCPYGWKFHPEDKTKMVIDKVEKIAVKRIMFLHYKTESTQREIARIMNHESPKVCRGEEWSHKLIGRIIKREKENGNSADNTSATKCVPEPEQTNCERGLKDEESKSLDVLPEEGESIGVGGTSIRYMDEGHDQGDILP